jgi:hypothetical protein
MLTRCKSNRQETSARGLEGNMEQGQILDRELGEGVRRHCRERG